MNSIQHYLNNNDNDKANLYLSDFAALIRMTMENAQDAFIPLSRELTRIKLYLSLEQLRFGEKLKFSIYIDPHLDTNIAIPNMILQPYIENAIWHGLIPKQEGGGIKISFLSTNTDKISITIEDDGVGISHTKEKKINNRRSFGMSLTEERLSLLKKLLNQYYTVSVRETYDPMHKSTGTLVEIIVPSNPNETEIKQMQDALKI